MDPTKSEETEEEPIVIPEQIQTILTQFRKSASCDGITPVSQQVFMVDGVPITKENNDLEYCKWIEDLLQDEPIDTRNHGTQYSNNLFSSGPIVPIEQELFRVSTPQKEQYYKVKSTLNPNST